MTYPRSHYPLISAKTVRNRFQVIFKDPDPDRLTEVKIRAVGTSN